VGKVTKVPETETPSAQDRSPVNALVRFLAALMVIALITIAFGLAAHGFHQMNVASPGISWVNT
jgi:hypothetical protein